MVPLGHPFSLSLDVLRKFPHSPSPPQGGGTRMTETSGALPLLLFSVDLQGESPSPLLMGGPSTGLRAGDWQCSYSSPSVQPTSSVAVLGARQSWCPVYPVNPNPTRTWVPVGAWTNGPSDFIQCFSPKEPRQALRLSVQGQWQSEKQRKMKTKILSAWGWWWGRGQAI